MPDELAVSLSCIDVFKGLSLDARRDLARLCMLERHSRGAEILRYGDRSDAVFFIVAGRVRVTIHGALAREIAYRDLAAGDMFGELAAIDGGERAASILCLEETAVLMMSRDAFWQAIHTYPAVADSVLRRLTHLVRLYSQRLFELRTLDVRRRVQAELVRMAREVADGPDAAVIKPPPTNAAIANLVCTRREAVSREISRLGREGILEKRQDALVIRDLRRLEQLAQTVDGA